MEGFVKYRLLTQEPAFQCCVTATEIKSEILDVDGRFSFSVVCTGLLLPFLDVQAPCPITRGPIYTPSVNYCRLVFLSTIP